MIYDKNNNMQSKRIYLNLLYFNLFLRIIKPCFVNRSLLSINLIFLFTSLFPVLTKDFVKEGYVKKGNKYISVVGVDKIKLTSDKMTEFFWNTDENYLRLAEGDKYLVLNKGGFKLQPNPESIKVFEENHKGENESGKKQLFFVPERTNIKNLIFHTKDDIKNNDLNEDPETSSGNKENVNNSDGDQEANFSNMNSEHETSQGDMTSNESNKLGKHKKKSKSEMNKMNKRSKKRKSAHKSSKKYKEDSSPSLYVSSSENEIQSDDENKKKANLKEKKDPRKENMKEGLHKTKDLIIKNHPFAKIFPGGLKGALLDSESEEKITDKSYTKNINKKRLTKKQITNNKHHNYLKSHNNYNKRGRNSLNNDTTEQLRKISKLVDKFRGSLEDQ